jgi:hypothetical protein
MGMGMLTVADSEVLIQFENAKLALSQAFRHVRLEAR